MWVSTKRRESPVINLPRVKDNETGEYYIRLCQSVSVIIEEHVERVNEDINQLDRS